MACTGTSLIIQDAHGSWWEQVVSTAGALGFATASAPTSPRKFYLRAKDDPTVNYRLDVATNGILMATLYPFGPNPDRVTLQDSNGVFYDLQIFANSDLYLSAGYALPPPWEVGELYPKNSAYPTPVQPGGPGTIVTVPAQKIQELTGRYRAGCGHSFNSYDIYEDRVSCVLSKIVCCPLCGYIQYIISPASDYNNFLLWPVLVG